MNPFVCDQCGVVAAGGMTRDSVPPTPGLSAAPESRHHILLNSNETPLDSDVVLVQSAISKVDERLAWLANETSQLQDRLQQLEEERVSLTSFRAQNCAILSPLRRMPPEVLSEVFAWTLPSARDLSRRRKPRLRDSPWILTHVSRCWRTVAVLNPSLWSIVAIKYQPGTDPSVYSLAMVEAQLARAKKLKIHFSGCQTLNPVPQIELFQCLSKHASRWEELTLLLTSDLYSIVNTLRGRVPSLRIVSIRWDREESQAEAHSIDFLESAPSLVYADVFNQYRTIPVSLPAQQLTRYYLESPWEMHRDVLKLASNLVEAIISIKFVANPWSESDGIIELSSLRRLYVSTPPVLCHIRVPALENLAMCYGSHRTTVAGDLSSLVARSACSLRSLCLSESCHAATNISILQSIPSIVELRIIITNDRVIRGVNNFIERLTVLPGSTPVIPQLSSLCLARASGVSDSYFDYAAHFEMAESRWKSQECTLSHAALIFRAPPIPSPASFADFDILCADGFNFVLVTDGAEARDIMKDWVCFSRVGLA
ncbi:hypothetical protein DFH06DRAFT_1092897 [Mycena polygramma]|nr:hypothetical protein DFH06DRAFT_1092897 [Mycena polygramma]